MKFLGYTLYNAKKYSGAENSLGIARAHFNYANQIPATIQTFVGAENVIQFSKDVTNGSIGNNSVIYTHNTFPSMSQKYHTPMWNLPNLPSLELGDKSTIAGNQGKYLETKDAYEKFAKDFLERVGGLDAES